MIDLGGAPSAPAATLRSERCVGRHASRCVIDLTIPHVTIAYMKRRLLFIILLAIVLALILKYGAHAAPLSDGVPPPCESVVSC